MWYYNNKEIGDDDIQGYVSFVYRITNLETGKQYIGKKNFTKVLFFRFKIKNYFLFKKRFQKTNPKI